MKITLISDDAIRLEQTPGPLTVEAQSAEQQYSPFHMLASSLAACTLSVLASWATHAGLNPDGLAIEVRWEFAENPHRVGTICIALHWPGLPAERAKTAERVAALCPIHGTLTHSPKLTTTIHAGSGNAISDGSDGDAGTVDPARPGIDPRAGD